MSVHLTIAIVILGLILYNPYRTILIWSHKNNIYTPYRTESVILYLIALTGPYWIISDIKIFFIEMIVQILCLTGALYIREMNLRKKQFYVRLVISYMLLGYIIHFIDYFKWLQ